MHNIVEKQGQDQFCLHNIFITRFGSLFDKKYLLFLSSTTKDCLTFFDLHFLWNEHPKTIAIRSTAPIAIKRKIHQSKTAPVKNGLA